MSKNRSNYQYYPIKGVRSSGEGLSIESTDEHPVVGWSEPFSPGVYKDVAEEIIVDPYSAEAHSVYRDLFNDALELSRGERQKHRLNDIEKEKSLLHAFYKVVRGGMSSQFEDQGIEFGSEVPVRSLADYIDDEIGVCRHKALTIASLVYMAEQGGFIKGGSVSVEASHRLHKEDDDDYASHAWVRYVNSEGEVLIFDAEMGYAGPLKGSDRFDKWMYARHEERQRGDDHQEGLGEVARRAMGWVAGKLTGTRVKLPDLDSFYPEEEDI